MSYRDRAVDLFQPLKPTNQLPNLVVPNRQGGENLASFDRRSWAKGYLEMNLSVVLEFAPKGNGPATGISMRAKNDFMGVDRPIFALYFNACDPRYGQHWKEESVFIVDVERVDGENIRVPSFVSLHMVYKEVVDFGTGVYASCFCGKNTLKPSFGLVRPDGEVCGTGYSSPRLSHNFKPSNVQSGAEVMDCIASYAGEFPPQHKILKRVAEELFPRLQIHIQSGAVAVGRSKDSIAELMDVLVGPLDF